MPITPSTTDGRRAGLPASAQPLYAALRDRLKGEILGGARKPGDKLPSESEMTAQFGVSRITVRQALGDLASEGLLVKAHGKGSYVALPPVAQELTRLTGLSESLSGAGRTVHTRVLSLRHVAAPPDAAARLGVPARTAVTELKTLRYLNRAPLVLNRSYMPRDLGERLMKADVANRDILDIFENDLGLAIGHAEVSIGALNAGRAHRLLGVAEGAALVHMQRLVHDIDGRPVHLETGDYRADRFTYSLTLERGSRTAPQRD